jgi:hypothetical protein
MKYYRILTLVLFALLLISYFSSKWGTDESKKTSEVHSSAIAHPSWQQVVEYAREHLPMEGQLKVKSDGFVYLKVDDAYIHNLFPMLELQKDGYREPPYFRTREAPGAHMSVFYENEHVVPEEAGQTFHFELKDIVIVKPSKHDRYAVLVVESPELEKLREKYGLSPKLLGHDFHITLAKKTIHPRGSHSAK